MKPSTSVQIYREESNKTHGKLMALWTDRSALTHFSNHSRAIILKSNKQIPKLQVPVVCLCRAPKIRNTNRWEWVKMRFTTSFRIRVNVIVIASSLCWGVVRIEFWISLRLFTLLNLTWFISAYQWIDRMKQSVYNIQSG